MAVSSTITKLQKQILALEEKVNKLQSKTKDMIDEIGFTVYTKNFLNLNINSSKSITIKTIKNNKSSQLYQLKIKFNNFVSQTITFKLFADNIQIASDTQAYNNGTNELIIYGSYANSVSDKIVIRLQIIPKSNKQLTITNSTLTIWGDTQKSNEEYQACETNTHYFLSYISDGRLYYKYFEKTNNADDIDFVFYENAISHAICQNNETIYILRVDENGNLFYSTYPNLDEKFISQNVSKVSCCFIGDSTIVYCYISRGVCYYGEIKNNTVISNKILNAINGIMTNCYLYYNQKCYLILTKSDSQNYLLENIQENFASSENINANINLSITIPEES